MTPRAVPSSHKYALVSGKEPVCAWLGDDDCACFGKSALAGEQVHALAPALFACADHKHETRRLLKSRRQLDGRRDKGRDPAFHVAAAPPVDLAIRDIAAERRNRPRGGPKRDDVGMPREAERKLGSVSTGPCDQIVPVCAHRHVAGLETGGFQELAEMARARSFIAGRIDRLEPDEFLRQLGGGDHGAASDFRWR